MAGELPRRLDRLGAIAGLVILFASGCAAEHVVGSLGFLVDVYAGPTENSSAVAVADVDGDGRADVVVVDGSQATVCVLAGNGDGTLGAASCQPLGAVAAAQFVVAGHFAAPSEAQTSKPWDLISAGARLAVLGGRGDGTFAVTDQTSLTSTGGAAAMITGDVNRDGIADVWIADSSSATVSVWPIAANQQLATPLQYSFSEPQRAIALADLDGDGRSELAGVSPDGLRVYGARGVVPIAQCPSIDGTSSFSDPTALALLDGSGDGDLDLVVADSGRGGIVLVHRSGPLSFDCGAGGLWQASGRVVALLGADFDGDGGADLLALTATGNAGAALLLLRGSGFSTNPAPRYLLPSAALAGAVGDLDGDGHVDAVVALTSGQIAVLRNVFGP